MNVAGYPCRKQLPNSGLPNLASRRPPRIALPRALPSDAVICNSLGPARRSIRAFAIGLAFLLGMAGASATQPLPGPAGPEEGPFRKQLWLLPSPEWNVLMRATVFRPPGKGPFPLVIVSHGSSEDPEARARQAAPTFEPLAFWFLKRGYMVVVPQRPGHGATGGTYLESNGSCELPDYRKSAFETAASIESAILFVMSYPFAQRSAVVLVGHSAGAWGSLALASRRPGIAKAVINFSGGRGGRGNNMANRNCAPDRLVSVAAEFGGTIRLPTLWLYTRNDSYFGPELSKRMADEFRAAGGRAEFHLLPPFGEEGHYFIHSPKAVVIWAPIVERFLAKIGKE